MHDIEDPDVQDEAADHEYAEDFIHEGLEVFKLDPVRLYHDQAFCKSLLTREEERDLARKIHAAFYDWKKAFLATHCGAVFFVTYIRSHLRNDLRFDRIAYINALEENTVGTKKKNSPALENVKSLFHHNLQTVEALLQNNEEATERCSRNGSSEDQEERKWLKRRQEHIGLLLAELPVRSPITTMLFQEFNRMVDRYHILKSIKSRSQEEQQEYEEIRSQFRGDLPHLKKTKEHLSILFDTYIHHRNAMVSANLRLVASIAKAFPHRKMEYLDVVEEGNFGLFEAIDRFDPEKGLKFSTYATWWIRQRIQRAFMDKGEVVRQPVYRHGDAKKVYAVTAQLTLELQRNPTPEEIAERTGMSLEALQSLSAILGMQSLDQEFKGKEGSRDATVGATSLFVDDSDIFAAAIVEERRQKIADALRFIPVRSRRILEMRYGLVNGESHTLEEVGNAFGITRERVRQIEGKAFRKLEKHLQDPSKHEDE